MAQSRGAAAGLTRGEQLLFLTDDQLRQGVELMFFAYRDMVSDPDRILEELGYGRAHHRALHFIRRKPGLSVAELLQILAVTKQSLNRVLRQLMADGLVENRIGDTDRRQRLLFVTPEGERLVRRLSDPQHERMRRVFLEAGPEAVQGFKRVLAGMIEEADRDRVLSIVSGSVGR